MFYSSVLTCALPFVFFWTKVEGVCPAGWERYQESCFSFVQRETSWNHAEADCIRKGARLTRIETVEENSYLRQYISNNSNKFYGYDMWLGAHVEEGAWKWVDGALMDPDAYNDWQQGKPALNSSLVCLEFESEFNNHWNDDYCDELNYHICERPFNPLTPPPLTSHPADTTPATSSDTAASTAATSPITSSSSSSVDTTISVSIGTTITATTPTLSSTAPVSVSSTASSSSPDVQASTAEVLMSGPTSPVETSAPAEVSGTGVQEGHTTSAADVHRSSISSSSVLVG